VLARIKALGIRRIVSLGDVIGYGPDPEACLRLVQQHGAIQLIGNHEYAVLNPAQNYRYKETVLQALDWTRERIVKSGLIESIRELEPEWQEDDVYFVHGTVRNPLHEYLREADSAGYSNFDEIVRSLESDFNDFRICFIGHNHRPFLATLEGFLHPHDSHREFHIASEDRLYVSVGSVGQPRDGDLRAGFVTYDGTQVSFHRVAYPFQITARKILAAGLPSVFASRLAAGT
jgi:diadenosine tetraphosphatase ApaH/serine/threonine PP2A family protein phosphatase